MAREKELEIMTRLGLRKIETDKILYFPRGLIGFETEHEFTILQIRPEAPFLLLQSVNTPELALVVADPYTFLNDYPVKVEEAEQALLCIKSLEQVAVLVTANVPAGCPEDASLNLMGPIIINHEAKLAMQVPQINLGDKTHYRISDGDNALEAKED